LYWCVERLSKKHEFIRISACCICVGGKPSACNQEFCLNATNEAEEIADEENRSEDRTTIPEIKAQLEARTKIIRIDIFNRSEYEPCKCLLARTQLIILIRAFVIC